MLVVCGWGLGVGGWWLVAAGWWLLVGWLEVVVLVVVAVGVVGVVVVFTPQGPVTFPIVFNQVYFTLSGSDHKSMSVEPIRGPQTHAM